MVGKLLKLWSFLAFIFVLAIVAGKMYIWISEQQEMACRLQALEAKVDAMTDGERKFHRDIAKWYNYNLEQGTPGLWSAYERVLDLEDGMMAILDVPDLRLRLPVSHGQESPVGHDPDTPLPIGGRGNHTVLFLSRGYVWEEGMPVYIDCLGRRIIYQVESVEVLAPPWPAEQPAEAGQDLLTLLHDRGNQRTLVRCVRCQSLSVRDQTSRLEWQGVVIAPLAVLLLSAVLRWYSAGKQKFLFCAFLPRKLRKNLVIPKL